MTRKGICHLFLSLVVASSLTAADLDAFRTLVRKETWTEKWPGKDGIETREVTAEIWTTALQAALDKDHTVHLPAREAPYYIDGPIILKSGDSFRADPTAEIRLKPGCNTCMIRNENVVGSPGRPVPEETQPDTRITIEGGIWTTLWNELPDANGNRLGRSSKLNPVPGTHGVILLQNVRQVVVRNVTVRQSKAFAVHLSNVRGFEIDGVTLDRHGRDGVHVNGPASEGIIRNVRGDSHDDTVSICAWDWLNCAPSFGAIHHLVIERISGVPEKSKSADAIRLLPGVKRFADGTTLDCPIHDVVLTNLTDIKEFKLYDQPNLELGRDQDCSVTLGKLSRIQMQHLTFTRPGIIKVATDVDGLQIDDVKLRLPFSSAYKLIEIGPMSQTYCPSPDPAKWVEIFSPDSDVTVKNFRLGNIELSDGIHLKGAEAETRLLQVKDQRPNPDYPKTQPRGGIGKAKLVR